MLNAPGAASPLKTSRASCFRVTTAGPNEHGNGWAFAQLGNFVAYKSKRAGVPVCFVDPRNTSRQCRSMRKRIDKKNPKDQAIQMHRLRA